MKKIFPHISPVILLMTLVSIAPGNVAASEETAVDIIAPLSVPGGCDIPMVFSAVDADGKLSINFYDDLPIQMTGIEGEAVATFKKGRSYLAVHPESDANEVSISFSGLSGSAAVSLVDTTISETHEGVISRSVETWNSDRVHVVTGNLTVPEQTELVIGEGTNLIVGKDCSITVNGTLTVLGTRIAPVLVTASSSDNPWGGIEIIGGSGDLSYCFLMYGGGDRTRAFGHSDSQPVLKAVNGDLTLDHCYLMYNMGKALGGSGGRITVDHSLIARCDTGGEFQNSVTSIKNTCILDIPDDDTTSVDDDNDGLYFSGVPEDSGEESLVENCCFITGEDDGIDHNGARLVVRSCWIEGFAHEGIAASSGNYVHVVNSVITACEQGIEAGYGSPEVIVDHCAVVGNDVGLRFGDSYDWGCTGSMNVANTIAYGNGDNIRNFDRKAGGPFTNGIVIAYSMTNDSDYDASTGCITGVPLFDEGYILADGSPGIGEGKDGSDMGLIRAHPESPLVINEILALNDGLYCDEFRDYDDWVEIYNPSLLPVDMGGMFVTDDPAVPVKWMIPDENPAVTTVPPEGYLILWLDGEPDQGLLHMDIRLSGAGETFALYAAGGSILIDTITFGEQAENVSYGRADDGGDTWRLFDFPTPGLSNDDADSPPVKEYFITCDPDSLAYIYAHYDTDIEIPITISHASRTWTDVTMRIRGETSRKYPKKSLRIEFDSEPFSTGRDVLIFNAEYHDKSYMHQYLSSMLFRESGHPGFEADYARLYLNGEYFGLYTNIESVDENFLIAREMDPDGNLYKAPEILPINRTVCLGRKIFKP